MPQTAGRYPDLRLDDAGPRRAGSLPRGARPGPGTLYLYRPDDLEIRGRRNCSGSGCRCRRLPGQADPRGRDARAFGGRAQVGADAGRSHRQEYPDRRCTGPAARDLRADRSGPPRRRQAAGRADPAQQQSARFIRDRCALPPTWPCWRGSGRHLSNRRGSDRCLFDRCLGSWRCVGADDRPGRQVVRPGAARREYRPDPRE